MEVEKSGACMGAGLGGTRWWHSSRPGTQGVMKVGKAKGAELKGAGKKLTVLPSLPCPVT